MTAPALPPPDLRDRDGWHMLRSRDGSPVVMKWFAVAQSWGTPNDMEPLWLPNHPDVMERWRYVAPLIAVTDDHATVERMARAAFEAVDSPDRWGDFPESVHERWREYARAAITEIRKGA